MDKKNNKFISFFKKEGFYVILFVCLCVVATVAAITARNNAKKVTPQANKGNVAVNINDSTKSTTQMPGAEQVKKPTTGNTATGVTVPNTKTVSNTSKITFNNPISDGAVSRAFSDGSKPIEVKGFNVWTTVIKGVGINAKKGTPVLAASEGKVTDVGTGDEFVGNYVVISHQNGMKTVYTNLDPQIAVKKDDVVKAKQTIGKVGDSARMLKFEPYAEHLGFQLLDSKDQQVDPGKYIKFKTEANK
ncbi:peptidoglycan DD-metalloendopeptidase family protein [Clostridium sp. C8-1-8]|uniref:peptidoglycan DD-metalloendopeptidase family protein n=1 Tax=Clostridium sp. C8-1-8 TaxID=2698831 RepID=UPI0013694895|nr:peptidoglycan DD-metalloendopeptidase family protein [Clostridium sp. C8-1-8]